MTLFILQTTRVALRCALDFACGALSCPVQGWSCRGVNWPPSALQAERLQGVSAVARTCQAVCAIAELRSECVARELGRVVESLPGCLPRPQNDFCVWTVPAAAGLPPELKLQLFALRLRGSLCLQWCCRFGWKCESVQPFLSGEAIVGHVSVE